MAAGPPGIHSARQREELCAKYGTDEAEAKKKHAAAAKSRVSSAAASGTF